MKFMKTKKSKKKETKQEPQVVFIGVDAASAYEQYQSFLKVGFTVEQAFALTRETIRETYFI